MGLYEQRTPTKLTVVKSRIHGWWIVTVFGHSDHEFPTWADAMKAVDAYLRDMGP